MPARKTAEKKPLRAVAADERCAIPPTLLEAIESGNVLQMLLAQRRLIAEALVNASENTRPQFNNELNKLHRLIAEEEARELVAGEEAAERDAIEDEPFDASAV